MGKKSWQKTARWNKLFLAFSFFFFSIGAFSQTITGTVTDADQRPVSNVTVTVKGTSRSAITDQGGKFSINASGNDVLVFTNVGFATQEVTVGGRQSLNVSMSIDVRNMENVVVTALGIRKEARKLGYSAETVKLDEIQKNRTNNLMASLEGKIAGLNISPPSAGAASSTRIRLRGQSAFAGADNAPLLVINGLPISQDAQGANGGGGSNGDSRDKGDNLLLVNPDDIESMTVLKGATAAAIYGSRASNGAIIITTKSGARNSGLGVELTTGYLAEQVLDYTDFQYEYGQGQGKTVSGVVVGSRPLNASEAQNTGQLGWGERYDGVLTPQFDGVSRPYSPHKGRLEEFFNTGTTLNNTIAVSGGNAKSSFRASYSNMDSKGITPGNEYNRSIFNLGGNQTFGDKLTVAVNVNYSFEKSLNPPQVGVQGQNYYNFIVRTSPVVPLSAFREKVLDGIGAEYPTNGFATSGTVLNPYFYIPREFYRNNRDRLLGTATVRYQVLDWLFLQGRVNMDYNNGFTEFNNPTGGLGAGGFGLIYYDNTQKKFNGNYNVSDGMGRQMNYDFLLGGNHKFGDFSVDASVGGNLLNAYGRNINASSTAFTERDIYSIGNGSVFTQGYNYSKRRVNSLYALAEFGYKNLIFINVTGREDWFSVLNPKNNHFFYPSVTGSFIFSELIKDKIAWLDYGKLRGGYASVGSANGINPYYGLLNYTFNTNLYTLPGIDFTIGNISGNDSPNPLVEPFAVTEKNIGLELKMFKSKVNLDIEVYDKRTKDQIIPSQISAASGYLTTVLNYGSLQNRGVEVLLDLTPVKTRNFSWNTAFNNAYNTSKVLALSPGTTRFTVVDWYNGGASNEFIGKLVYEVGKPLNQIAAKTYLRDNKGQILLTSGGRLIPTPNDVLFGSADPKFVGGWNNSFRFKNLSLLVHMDYKFGGKLLSGSALNALRQGHSKASLVGRRPGENGVVFGGVYQTGANAGQPNTTAVFGQAFYADYRSQQIADPFVFKSDFIKLRNITLSYDFSSLIGSRVKFVKGLTLAASCRNVAIIKKYVPDIDPESFASSGDSRLGYEAVSLPTTRTWGVNLNVKF